MTLTSQLSGRCNVDTRSNVFRYLVFRGFTTRDSFSLWDSKLYGETSLWRIEKSISKQNTFTNFKYLAFTILFFSKKFNYENYDYCRLADVWNFMSLNRDPIVHICNLQFWVTFKCKEIQPSTNGLNLVGTANYNSYLILEFSHGRLVFSWEIKIPATSIWFLTLYIERSDFDWKSEFQPTITLNGWISVGNVNSNPWTTSTNRLLVFRLVSLRKCI